jgi:pimeloyl-ACP methyl ester carboxylesterase
MMLDVDGRAVEAAWWGAPNPGPTLVLLHEGLGCVALWRDFPQRLADATGCGVFAYSRFGYGASDGAALPWPMDYMHREAARLPRVLDAAGIGRCVLVGHSDGGSIAAIAAGSRQDFRLRGLVLISPHFFVEDLSIASIAAAKVAYETGDLRARLGRYHRDVDNAFHGWNGAWLDPRFRAFDLTPEIAHLRIPVLALQGTEDPYGTRRQLDVLAAESYAPVEVHLIDGARHAAHLEAPAAVDAAVTDFVRRLEL